MIFQALVIWKRSELTSKLEIRHSCYPEMSGFSALPIYHTKYTTLPSPLSSQPVHKTEFASRRLGKSLTQSSWRLLQTWYSNSSSTASRSPYEGFIHVSKMSDENGDESHYKSFRSRTKCPECVAQVRPNLSRSTIYLERERGCNLFQPPSFLLTYSLTGFPPLTTLQYTDLSYIFPPNTAILLTHILL